MYRSYTLADVASQKGEDMFRHFVVNEHQFRTGWFMESPAMQVLVVFVIRTNDRFI
jgi:hypothetical protein